MIIRFRFAKRDFSGYLVEFLAHGTSKYVSFNYLLIYLFFNISRATSQSATSIAGPWSHLSAESSNFLLWFPPSFFFCKTSGSDSLTSPRYTGKALYIILE